MVEEGPLKIWNRYGSQGDSPLGDFYLPEAREWMPGNALLAYQDEEKRFGVTNGHVEGWMDLQYSDEHSALTEILAAKKLLEDSIVAQSMEIISERNSANSAVIVEAFSGQAPISTALVMDSPGNEYLAFDIDGRNAAYIDNGVDFKQHDIMKAPFDLEDDSVDLIVDLNGLYTVTIGGEEISSRQVEERYRKVIKEYERILKTGGKIIINGPFQSDSLANPVIAIRNFIFKENHARVQLDRPLLKIEDLLWGDVSKVLRRNASLVGNCRFIPESVLVQMIEETGTLSCEKVRSGSYYGANTYLKIVKSSQ
ncbi:methyltransferase domain-containing protein [Candidatus Dojkabacteria bacterium]|nr:methyltransferase domain-containing protein [Candidatus Dojkabacteria bacterium]